MEFDDDGIVLTARAHGETHAIAEIFTANHGRWAGLVYGGQGRKMQPLLQAGNGVRVHWRGRGAGTLGNFALELTAPRAGDLMQDALSLSALSASCSVALSCLPEREAHAPSYEAMVILLDVMENVQIWPALMARWEVGLLAELGFGLTLDKCAASGTSDDLIYVSPKSAQAVSASAGEPYKDKLFALPEFLKGGPASIAEAAAGLEMTGYFIETRILHPTDRELPLPRQKIVTRLKDQ